MYRKIKTFIVLLLVIPVFVVCGQFFGWWNLPVPGLEFVPSYKAKKMAREAERMALRRQNGLEEPEDEEAEEEVQKAPASIRPAISREQSAKAVSGAQ